MKKNKEKYDLVITPHRQSTGYIRIKRKKIKGEVLSKQRQITQKRFSKQRNAFSESETSHLQELYRIKDSINKSYPVNDRLYFSDSETTSHSSKQGKRRIKTSEYKINSFHFILFRVVENFARISAFIK